MLWGATHVVPEKGLLNSFCSLPLTPLRLLLTASLQEHGGDASAGYAEMGSKGGSEGGSKGGEARKEQLAAVSAWFLMTGRSTCIYMLAGSVPGPSLR